MSAPADRGSLERYFTDRKEGLLPRYCFAPWTEVARRVRCRVAERLFPACTGCFHYYSDRESDRAPDAVLARPAEAVS